MGITEAARECTIPVVLSSIASLVSFLVLVSTLEESEQYWKVFSALIGFVGFLSLTVLVIWKCDK